MIFKIILKILLFLLLLILVLGLVICLSSVKISFRYWNEKLEWSVRYFGIQILPRKKKQKPPASEDAPRKKGRKKAEKPEASEPEEPQKPYLLLMDKIWKKMQSTAGKMDKAGNAFYALPDTMRWFVKSVRIHRLKTDFIIGDEDAAVCARNYGMIQTALQAFSSFMNIKKREIAVRCDFTQDTCHYQISTVISIQIGLLILTGLVFVIEYLKNRHKDRKILANHKL